MAIDAVVYRLQLAGKRDEELILLFGSKWARLNGGKLQSCKVLIA